jgi:hypothetical protein
MLPEDPAPWTWVKHVSGIDGAVSYRGEHPYRSAWVTRSGGTSGPWQACVPTVSAGDQRSPYYASPASAKKWAERYGTTRARRTRRR